ncbi:MAG TPA: fatty acid desaturase [Synechococcales cyanobacterium M55_K2018_004]|nr:fatty acid desaturase [Synechococcales cyanobacterium M55_K2018_004]
MTSSSVQPTPQNRQVSQINWVNLGFFAAVHLLALLAPWFFSWSALGVAIFLHWLFGSIGICLAYHRMLTHRSFQVPKWFEYILTTIGAMALEGGPIFWVSGHRLHHAHTEDEDKDPYSSRRGFWWSHFLWLIYPREEFFNIEAYQRYAPDLARDPYYRWLDKYFVFLQIPLGVALYFLGGWPFVIYGMFVRTVVLWHSTWFINSATHMFGYRNFDSEDNSRNLWWAAILAYGEGWHNNHHTFPNMAKAGLRWYEFDPTYWVIKALQIVGLARKVVNPPAQALKQLQS